MIGLPVTALTESAAPPRASPSSLVSRTPSNSTRSAKLSATLTASWPVIASRTSRTSWGLVALADRDELVHQLLVDVQAPGGVDDQHVVRRPPRAWPSAHSAIVDRVALGALLVDGRAGCACPSSPAARPRPGAAVSQAASATFLPSSPRCLASFAQAVVLPEPWRPGHQDHGRAARRRTRGRGRRRPSAPRAPR